MCPFQILQNYQLYVRLQLKKNYVVLHKINFVYDAFLQCFTMKTRI